MPKKKPKKVRVNVRVSYPRAGEFLVGVTLDEADLRHIAAWNTPTHNRRAILDEIVDNAIREQIKIELADKDSFAVVKRAVAAYLAEEPTSTRGRLNRSTW